MIVILSMDSDYSTDKVISWIEYYKQSYLRLSAKSFYKNLKWIDLKNDVFYFENDEKLDLNNIGVVWNRRWLTEDFLSDVKKDTSFKSYLSEIVKIELKCINDYFFKCISRKMIDFLDPIKSNKIYQCRVAESVGLLTPNSYIVGRKSVLEEISKKNNLITKSILSSFSWHISNNELYSNYTSQISKDDINSFTESFFPSLVQVQIEKLFEIRVFYFFEKLYCMAIFSQENDKTKVDFRQYDHSNPNKNVTYKMPEFMKKKIITFMSVMKLKTGSLDFIFNTNEEYVFLEVNPVGQFDNVSKNCNFDLEKVIAEKLIEIDNEII